MKLELAAVVILLAACGGTTTSGATVAAGETTTTAPLPESTTTSIEATTTTTEAPTTTTTTAPALDAEEVNAAFRAYFDLIAAADYEGAREISSGTAADYASFTEHLGLVSPQPNWQFESSPEEASGDAVLLDDGRYGAVSSLVYIDGGSRLEVTNPVVSLAESTPLLDEWGVDLGSGIDQPSLRQRLKLIGTTLSIEPSNCYDTGMWAYVPGGSDTSETVRIITLGLACSTGGDLTPQEENSRLFSADGTVEAIALGFFLQGGVSSVAMNTPTLYLALFDIPAEAASADLIWETPFERSNVPATSIHSWPIGPFDLG